MIMEQMLYLDFSFLVFYKLQRYETKRVKLEGLAKVQSPMRYLLNINLGTSVISNIYVVQQWKRVKRN